MFGPGGLAYVSTVGDARIKVITPYGVISTLAGSSNGLLDGIGTAARFFQPMGLAFDIADANLIVVDTGNNRRVQLMLLGAALPTPPTHPLYHKLCVGLLRAPPLCSSSHG